MASITKDAHQPPRSPFWIACYNGVGSAGGIRLKRSTETTERKLAQKLADEWEALEKLAGEKRPTESHCRKVVAQMYERTVGEPLLFHTAHEFLTVWVEGKKNETELRAWLKYSDRQRISRPLRRKGRSSLTRDHTSRHSFLPRRMKLKGLAAPL